MADYKIRIREILEMTVTVEAKSAEEARQIVKSGYKNSDHILTADHFKDVSFSLAGRSERER